jgi:predicted DNA-binding transcriptional regulator YafY
MKTTTETLLRQWAMLRHIPRHPGTITAQTLKNRLADEGHAVTKRTVERDLVKLSQAFGLGSDTRDRVQHWFWPENLGVFDIPGMDPAAALGFRIAEAYLRPLLPPVTLDVLGPYFEQAGRVLDVGSSTLKGWQDKVRVIPRGPERRVPWVKPEVQKGVYQALLEERRLRVDYHPKGAEHYQTYEVSPLGLVVREGLLYLVSTLWDYEDIKQLVCHRMTTATVLEKPVERPKGFDLDRYLREQGEFAYPTGKGKIRLRVLFDEAAAQHLSERPLADDQDLKKRRDGRVLLTATVLDTYELRWWLLGFGEQVEVVGPKGLREEFREVVQRMADRYSTARTVSADASKPAATSGR